MKPEETIKKLVRAANKHDPSAVAEVYATTAVAYDPGYPDPLRGIDSILKDYEAFFVKAMPDTKFSLVRMVSEGNVVATEVAFKGTHTGPLETPDGTIEATNKGIDVKGAIFFVRFNTKGQILEERRYFDMAGFMRQLGLK